MSERHSRGMDAGLLLVRSCGSQLEAAAGYRFDPDRLQGVGKHHVPEIGDERGGPC
ncbi:MAG: hypothetical protein WBP81_30525 [Solirubrobacteraceae bacterium]